MRLGSSPSRDWAGSGLKIHPVLEHLYENTRLNIKLSSDLIIFFHATYKVDVYRTKNLKSGKEFRLIETTLPLKRS
jgi:hypothetical protein